LNALGARHLGSSPTLDLCGPIDEVDGIDEVDAFCSDGFDEINHDVPTLI